LTPEPVWLKILENTYEDVRCCWRYKQKVSECGLLNEETWVTNKGRFLISKHKINEIIKTVNESNLKKHLANKDKMSHHTKFSIQEIDES